MRSVIYIDRNNLYFYGGNVHTPVAFPFPKTAVNDMEVINPTELSTQIGEWIKTQKIEPSPAIIVVSQSVYFQKEIPEATPPEKHAEMKKMFIENVPFNDVYAQEIIVGKSTLLIAVNTEFVYIIRDIFHTFGFTVEAIAAVAEVYGLQPVSAFSTQVAQDALKKITKDNGFPLIAKEDIPASQSEDPLPHKQSNKRLYAMVAVFVVLLIILGVVYYMSRKPKKVRKVPPAAPVVKPTQIIEASSSAIPGNASVESALSILKKDLRIQILNGSGTPGQADRIRQNLLDIDFENITTGNAIGPSTKTLIIYKRNVGQKERDEIIEVLEPFIDEYTVQEKDDISVDVQITTSPQTVTPTP